MWTLKYEISSPNLYKLLLKNDLKSDTAIDLKKLYNYVKTCLNSAKNYVKIY